MREYKSDNNNDRDIFNLTLLRLNQVLQIIPVSKSTWWDGIKKGKYPKPIKLSERCSVWRLEDIKSLIAKL